MSDSISLKPIGLDTMTGCGSATPVSDCHSCSRAPSVWRPGRLARPLHHADVMTDLKQTRRGTLWKVVDAILRRFRGKRGALEAEAEMEAPDIDPVIEAGEESFPASDPPSFTPEKST